VLAVLCYVLAGLRAASACRDPQPAEQQQGIAERVAIELQRGPRCALISDIPVQPTSAAGRPLELAIRYSLQRSLLGGHVWLVAVWIVAPVQLI
jgi:hypothetical protein